MTPAIKKNILERWKITEDELTEILDANPSMRGLVIGYIAEYKLLKMHFSSSCFSRVYKADDHDREKKGDLRVTYKEREFKIECKSLQSNSIKHTNLEFLGKYQCDASDRRTVVLRNGEKIQTTCLLAGEFDIIAVNLFAFKEDWFFAFALNEQLPRSAYQKYSPEVREQLLSTLMPISWPLKNPYIESPIPLFEYLLNRP